ncbi:MAG: THUMP domain-containing class I SAM-dependent RNA methyltransferase [Flavobacteriaceae bacterium]
MGHNFEMLAKTFFGMEALLADELKALGAQEVKTGTRLVRFKGDIGFMYKANLCLRTALKILKPIHFHRVQNENEYYDHLFHFPWENYLNVDQSFAFDVVVLGDRFRHSLYMSQRAKDAVVDRFRKRTGKRPNVDLQHPDFKFHIHIHEDRMSLALDSSGASLHKRGYRSATNIAPLNEVLAAGVLLLSGWEGQSHFLDPMCGSGTLAIEAAMIAANIPANINRSEFAFEKWPDWDASLFSKIFDAQLERTKTPAFRILAMDKAPSAVYKTQDNVKNAHLEEFVEVDRSNFFHSSKSVDGPLHLVCNPPYGERLTGDMEALYKNFGDTLKQKYSNTNAWILSSNRDALKSFGLRPQRRIKLYNGKLEARLAYFPIYEGSKKAAKSNSNAS